MLFTLTFFTGAALGMYMYVAVWKPVYLPEDLGSEEAAASDWSIVGERRQGYINDASFRLLSDGTYTLMTIDEETGESVVSKKGSVSGSLVKKLMLTEDEILPYKEDKECEISEDVEYEYRFTVDGYTYLLDTCETELGHDTELAISLQKVWQSIDEGDGSESMTPSKWLQKWLNENIGVENKD